MTVQPITASVRLNRHVSRLCSPLPVEPSARRFLSVQSHKSFGPRDSRACLSSISRSSGQAQGRLQQAVRAASNGDFTVKKPKTPRKQKKAVKEEPIQLTDEPPPELRVDESGLVEYLPLTTVVDENSGTKLDCVVHHTFKVKSKTLSFLEPLDTPIQVLRGEGSEDEDMGDLTEEEMEKIYSDLATALGQRRLRLYKSAFCMTVRGSIRYYDGETVMLDEGDGDEWEGIELAQFASHGNFYSVYGSADPLLFPACKLPDGSYEIVAEDLGEDKVIKEMNKLQQRLQADSDRINYE